MKKNNILITSAGRRVSLVKAFVNATKKLKIKSKVFITDLNPNRMAPASFFADKSFKIGFFSDSNYMSDLLKICIDNKVKIIIPTIDTELLLYSKSKHFFEEHGIRIIVSEIELIKTLRNKILTNDFFNNLNINTPTIFNKNNLVFPVFLKPIDGSNSNGIYRADNINEIKPSDLDSANILILENIDSKYYDEYTVDLYYDKSSHLKCVVPRIRLKVVGGESFQGITKKNEVFEFVKDKLHFLNGAIGCLTLQLFSNKDKPEDILGIEINPRFGGGYPFSLNAGANFPEFILREYLLNEKINFFDDWKHNCLNLRFTDEVVIND
jgi:carbamoyl-phosphate synthase large subunit